MTCAGFRRSRPFAFAHVRRSLHCRARGGANHDIVAANISSHHFVGVMGTAYRRGFAAMTIEWGAILIGFNALLWIFLPFYLRNGFYTVPEFLQRRYGTAARLAFAALTLLVYVFVEISAVLYLGAIPMSL